MKKIFVFLLLISCFLLTSCVRKFDSNLHIIKFSTWGSQTEIAILKDVIDDFEKLNPDIKVELLHIPQNYFQKIHLLFASNIPPDVIFINNLYSKKYINGDKLLNLTPYIFNENETDIYYEPALNCFRQDENIYAVPRDISNLVIYYNKDIFKKNHINYNKPINDYYEFIEILKKVKTKENFSINFENMPLIWQNYLASKGGGILSDDCKSFIIFNDTSINALQEYIDFTNKEHFSPSKSEIGSLTTAQMFIRGQLAMYISGRWMTPKFREVVNFDWDIMEFPTINNQKLLIDSSGWAISKQSKEIEASIKFVKYLSSHKVIEKFTQNGLIIPARTDCANSELFLDKDKLPQHSEIFLKTIQNSKSTPINENYQFINDILMEETEEAFNGTKTVKECLTEKTKKRLNSML